ncbi:hypothetical protein M9H77_11963 [Catharanthus roseus]|uniref:Uncharacterized protein n=1 Tax=Catharanthus roseus TaxID=4058 RepID=A0ACC0BFZ5_CATRO|nr:hypothetical protein M9H77_11963 [Catharanthus roseus]
MESFQSSNRTVLDSTRSSIGEPKPISRNAPEWFRGVSNSPSFRSLSSSNSDWLETASSPSDPSTSSSSLLTVLYNIDGSSETIRVTAVIFSGKVVVILSFVLGIFCC